MKIPWQFWVLVAIVLAMIAGEIGVAIHFVRKFW